MSKTRELRNFIDNMSTADEVRGWNDPNIVARSYEIRLVLMEIDSLIFKQAGVQKKGSGCVEYEVDLWSLQHKTGLISPRHDIVCADEEVAAEVGIIFREKGFGVDVFGRTVKVEW